MTTEQIITLGPALADFLTEFADCFGRPEPRQHLSHYIRGQLSDLPRKSVEPIAFFNEVRPRTLQEFLNSDAWDHPRLRDRLQQIVARDHADPQAIGIVDESGHLKKGKRTAGVQVQHCGLTHKTDNCVVTVHLSYASGDTHFRTMLDSDLYLPESWASDRPRCRQAGIPDDLAYEPKYVIALRQIDRALANGIHFAWITADEWYGAKSPFLIGLEQRQCHYVVEIPRNLHGWTTFPGRQPRWDARPVEHLCGCSRPLIGQPWTRFHIKDTNKGPLVWEIKAVDSFWQRREGVPVGPYWLIHARDVLHPTEEKYFLVHAPSGTKLETILHVAFGRWPVERCLQDEKSELGLSHFEVRNYQALWRHLLITQLSHLFCARQTQRLRGEKPAHHFVPSPRCRQRPHRHLVPAS
jgi:SRSO17 transposase